MLGVIASPAEEHIVREFFELFKTPWEFYRPDGRYDVVLCSDNSNVDEVAAKLVLIYGAANAGGEGGALSPFPIYGAGSRVIHIDQAGERTFTRVGYDLFKEVERLLTAGQPPGYAEFPTLDLH